MTRTAIAIQSFRKPKMIEADTRLQKVHKRQKTSRRFGNIVLRLENGKTTQKIINEQTAITRSKATLRYANTLSGTWWNTFSICTILQDILNTDSTR
uniref:Uncharacterized protein n=1 Tax=Octopus bimaculoides TaxID=37653 RepID=A0A0L8FK18_OCTBM